MAVSALHFYESKGLIHSQRNAGNQRRYRRDVLRAVAIIKIAQRIGIPLATIGDAFGVLPEGHNPAQRVEDAVIAVAELDRRIHTLTALRDLDGCIGCGCLSRRDCPLRNPGDKLGKREPAPGCWKTSDKTKAPQLGALVVFRSWSFALSRWFARGFPRRRRPSVLRNLLMEVPVCVDTLTMASAVAFPHYFAEIFPAMSACSYS